MLMYYDARPCGMNGLFAHETYEPLKGYYSFAMFDKLAKMGNYAECEYKKEDIYTCAATDGHDGCVMMTYYSENDDSEAQTVELEINANTETSKVEIYVLDEDKNLELASSRNFTTKSFSLILDMKIHSSILIKII